MKWLKRRLPYVFDRLLIGQERCRIPIFPLNTVLYPQGLLPLRIFETRYMNMVKACMKDSLPFGICLIRTGAETGATAMPFQVGTLATIADWDMPQLGLLNITAKGAQRFFIESADVMDDGLMVAEVSMIPAEPPCLVSEEYAFCATVFDTILQEVGEMRFSRPMHPEQMSWLGYRLAESLPLKAAAKQDMLEMNDSEIRLKILLAFLRRQGVYG
ncbi:MAG TPA: LON peptidase substrate-binding domain-containing protein [Burkholderiales bacterium]|nr:LON peptidase substrate-binding domain-containing protein [Burkholderiales bacterium]